MVAPIKSRLYHSYLIHKIKTRADAPASRMLRAGQSRAQGRQKEKKLICEPCNTAMLFHTV